MSKETIKCPNCNDAMHNSYVRIEKSDGSNLGCYDCGITFKEKTVSKCRVCQYPFYKENLIHIIQTGRCDECNGENRLPEELVEYADPDGMIRKEL